MSDKRMPSEEFMDAICDGGTPSIDCQFWMRVIVELGDKLSDLWRDHARWSQATFGSDEERGPVGPLKHLEKEAGEAQAAWKDAYEPVDGEIVDEEKYAKFKEELADCLLLLLDASRRGGVKVMQLIEAAQVKLEKNKQRTWPKSSADEPVEHIR